jgi:SPP1 family predicted phage head-tail adaptor
MRAGKLRQEIVLQQLTSTTGDGAGGVASEIWTDFATVYADVEPLQGRELYQAQQINDELTHQITMRYYPGVASTMRVKYGTRILLIESIIDTEEGHRQLLLICKEQVAA